jgi:HlyD family secretion protein
MRRALNPSRRRLTGVAAIVLATTGGVVWTRVVGPQAAQSAPLNETIQVTGSVQPVTETPLDFGAPGEVVSVDVKEGQMVDAGTALARLDVSPLQSQLAQAQGALGTAQAKLAQDEVPVPAESLAGALGTAVTAQDQTNSARAAQLDLQRTNQQDVAVAQNAVAAAQAAGAAAVVTAQNQVAGAQANLADLVAANQQGATAARLGVTQAQQTGDSAVATAQAQVNTASKGVADAQRTGQSNVAAAQAAVQVADATVSADQKTVAADQAKLQADQATESSDCGASPPSSQCSADHQSVAADQRQLSVDQQTLPRDQASAQSARQSVTQAQAQAQQAANAAQAQLDAANVTLRNVQSARSTNVAIAQNALAQELAKEKGGNDQAKVVLNASVAGLQSAQSALVSGVRTAQGALAQTLARAQASNDQGQAQVNAATVALQNAQRNIQALERGPIPQLLMGDETGINSAFTQMTSVQHSIDAATLVAPLRGFVERINTFVGAKVDAGVPAKTNHAMVLYTPGAFSVTGGVSDAQVGVIRLGDPVTAVPAGGTKPITGTITQVSPAATVRNGVPTYDVTATLQPADLSLPPGGRATMSIVVRRVTAAVVVPKGAVHTIGQWNVVMVPEGNRTVARPVTLGASGGGKVEITGGLSAGQRIAMK